MLRWLPYVAWPLVLLVFAVVLFQVKHNARKLDRDVRSVQSQIEAKEESIKVLHAEWSHLNQPGYIAALASHHLGYDPENRTRIVNISELPFRQAPVPKRPNAKPAEPVKSPSVAPANTALRRAGFSIPLTQAAPNQSTTSGQSAALEAIPEAPVGINQSFVQRGLLPKHKPAAPLNFGVAMQDGIRSLISADPMADLINQQLGQ